MPNDQNSDSSPHIEVIAQYIKDLSFENPAVPEILNNAKRPDIELSLDLRVVPLEEDDFFEVEIAIEAKTKLEQIALFLISLRYAGVFHLVNTPSDHQQPVLAIDCPSIIFPYARKIIADITQGGGWHPLMLDPIDFGELYNKKLKEKGN